MRLLVIAERYAEVLSPSRKHIEELNRDFIRQHRSSSIGAEAPMSTKWRDLAATILKLNEQREIQGLTTAAGLWMTAAIGVACGLGGLGLAVISTIMALLILALANT